MSKERIISFHLWMIDNKKEISEDVESNEKMWKEFLQFEKQFVSPLKVKGFGLLKQSFNRCDSGFVENEYEGKPGGDHVESRFSWKVEQDNMYLYVYRREHRFNKLFVGKCTIKEWNDCIDNFFKEQREYKKKNSKHYEVKLYMAVDRAMEHSPLKWEEIKN